MRWSMTFGFVTLDDCRTDDVIWSSNDLNHLPGWLSPTRAGRIDDDDNIAYLQNGQSW